MSDVRAAVIDLRDVTKRYRDGEGERAAVSEITLTVQAGTFTALAGPSGSGKTTLLALMGGMTTPTEGSIHVLDEDVVALRDHHRADFRARHIGFVFQDLGLIDSLSLLENCLLPLVPQGGADAGARERARGLLSDLGLGDRLGTRAHRLSGGERQRGAIARALVTDPQIVLMDEPTAHVDRASADRVIEILAGLRDAGRTVIVSSHDPRVLERAEVDRVITLRDGRLDV